jgi:hypothetical protein
VTIRTRIKLVALLGLPIIIAFTWAAVRFLSVLANGAVSQEYGWTLLFGLLAIMVWVLVLTRIRAKEDAGSIRCDCGASLRRMIEYETVTSSVGKCDSCGFFWRIEKKPTDDVTVPDEEDRPCTCGNEVCTCTGESYWVFGAILLTMLIVAVLKWS